MHLAFLRDGLGSQALGVRGHAAEEPLHRGEGQGEHEARVVEPGLGPREGGEREEREGGPEAREGQGEEHAGLRLLAHELPVSRGPSKLWWRSVTIRRRWCKMTRRTGQGAKSMRAQRR